MGKTYNCDSCVEVSWSSATACALECQHHRDRICCPASVSEGFSLFLQEQGICRKCRTKISPRVEVDIALRTSHPGFVLDSLLSPHFINIMPTFYHATSARNQHSIEREGFRPGSGGYDGPGVYFCKRPEAAINRARLPRGEDAVVFACEIPVQSISNVGNQDNFKVETGNARHIRPRGCRRYGATEVSRIKADRSYMGTQSAPLMEDTAADKKFLSGFLGGAAAGAMVGAALAGPVGAVVGGIVGAMWGSKS